MDGAAPAYKDVFTAVRECLFRPANRPTQHEKLVSAEVLHPLTHVGMIRVPLLRGPLRLRHTAHADKTWKAAAFEEHQQYLNPSRTR